MKRWMYTIVFSIGTMLYGLSGIFHQTYIRILEPPMRYALIAGLIFIPILMLIGLYLKKANFTGTMLVGLSGVWGGVTVLYAIHPVPNDNWILSGIITTIALVMLLRGDWSNV